MAAPLGQSFAPIGAADEETKRANPAQQAIQVLSMRIPRVRGARTISPLIGESRSAAVSQVGDFSPESAVLQTLMKTIGAGASLPMGTMPGSGGMHGALGALGAPVITPGIQDPRTPPPVLPAPEPESSPLPPPAPEPRPRQVPTPMPGPSPRVPQDDVPAELRRPMPTPPVAPVLPAPELDSRLIGALVDLISRGGQRS